MNCQISEGRLAPPVFREKAGEVVFSFGQNGITVHLGIAVLREHESKPFNFDGYTPLVLKMNGDALLFSFKVWSPTGKAPIEVENNEFTVTLPGADWNYSENALEVIDSSGNAVFQMIRKAKYVFVVNGIFRTPSSGIIVAHENGFSLNPIVPKRIKPIFKYPAWKFPGKYADGSN